ncbi:unnamed protein product [Effrenium voratum]|uniref:Uncharacterized protein n=1 Tax=Effrenium voratum TaxID=2562239 RepID=A0AA36HRR9_9DINO|nr:unnamed protein product [Effrenium voratum]CAJ1421682.1 unnamed protein product [Effrenium voratum]
MAFQPRAQPSPKVERMVSMPTRRSADGINYFDRSPPQAHRRVAQAQAMPCQAPAAPMGSLGSLGSMADARLSSGSMAAWCPSPRVAPLSSAARTQLHQPILSPREATPRVPDFLSRSSRELQTSALALYSPGRTLLSQPSAAPSLAPGMWPGSPISPRGASPRSTAPAPAQERPPLWEQHRLQALRQLRSREVLHAPDAGGARSSQPARQPSQPSQKLQGYSQSSPQQSQQQLQQQPLQQQQQQQQQQQRLLELQEQQQRQQQQQRLLESQEQHQQQLQHQEQQPQAQPEAHQQPQEHCQPTQQPQVHAQARPRPEPTKASEPQAPPAPEAPNSNVEAVEAARQAWQTAAAAPAPAAPAAVPPAKPPPNVQEQHASLCLFDSPRDACNAKAPELLERLSQLEAQVQDRANLMARINRQQAQLDRLEALAEENATLRAQLRRRPVVKETPLPLSARGEKNRTERWEGAASPTLVRRFRTAPEARHSDAPVVLTARAPSQRGEAKVAMVEQTLAELEKALGLQGSPDKQLILES